MNKGSWCGGGGIMIYVNDKSILSRKFILDKIVKYLLYKAFNTNYIYILLKTILVTGKNHQFFHKTVRDV